VEHYFEEIEPNLIINLSNPEGNILKGVKVDYSNFPDCNEYKKIIITGDNVVLQDFSVINLFFLQEIEITGEIVKLGNFFIDDCPNLTKLSVSGLKTLVDGFRYRQCPNIDKIIISSAEEETVKLNCHFGRPYNGCPDVIIDGKKIVIENAPQKRLGYYSINNRRYSVVEQ